MHRSAHHRVEYPDFLQLHAQSQFSAAVRRKADSEVSSDAQKDQVYAEAHPHPVPGHLNKHQPQYSPSQSDSESGCTSERYSQDVSVCTEKVSFLSYQPVFRLR